MLNIEFTSESIGKRVRHARESARMTQEVLSAALDLDRSAIARIEKGDRKISAAELAAASELLDRSFGWFLQPDSDLVSARRAAISPTDESGFDRQLEEVVTHVRWAARRGLIPAVRNIQLTIPHDHQQAEQAATEVRTFLAAGTEPLIDLSSAAERLGLLSFSFPFPDSSFDGSMTEIDIPPGTGKLAVALINGSQRSGRRRFTLAHEIGHWVFGDVYDDHDGTTSAAAQNQNNREKMIDSFAAHLLLPRSGVVKLWNQHKTRLGERDTAVHISAMYRTSWTATIGQLSNLDLIGADTFRQMEGFSPTRGDFEALGLTLTSELEPVDVPPGYRSSVLKSFRERGLSRSKCLDLLFHSITREDLPTQIERGQSHVLSPVHSSNANLD